MTATVDEEGLRQRIDAYCTEKMEEGFRIAQEKFVGYINTLTNEYESLKILTYNTNQDVIRLQHTLAEIQSRPGGSHSDTALDRVNRVNLLSKRKPKPFSDKANCVEWAGNLRAGIQPQIPEIKDILDFAKNIKTTTHNHLTTMRSNRNITK